MSKKLTLQMILNDQDLLTRFIDWMYEKKYLSRNRLNLERKLSELNTEITIEDLEYHGLIERIAPDAIQEHYQRCIFN